MPSLLSGWSRRLARALEAAKVGEEGDQDVRFDALDQLRVDRTQLQVVLEVLERGLDLGELDIESPQLGRLASA